ncbi:hypothetical protein THAOC_23507, partial [Thalassiosira oceanica]
MEEEGEDVYFPSFYSVQGLVWTDVNENGLYENGEPLMEKQIVSIRRCRDDTGGVCQNDELCQWVQTEFTDENGQYAFYGVEGGDYYIEFFLPEVKEGRPERYGWTIPDRDKSRLDSDVVYDEGRKGKTSCFSAGLNALEFNAGFVRSETQGDLTLLRHLGLLVSRSVVLPSSSFSTAVVTDGACARRLAPSPCSGERTPVLRNRPPLADRGAVGPTADVDPGLGCPPLADGRGRETGGRPPLCASACAVAGSAAVIPFTRGAAAGTRARPREGATSTPPSSRPPPPPVATAGGRHHETPKARVRAEAAEGPGRSRADHSKIRMLFGCQPRPPPLPDRSEAIRGERPGWQVRSKALGLPPSGQAVSETGEACANCGKHGSNTVKLKNCTACRLVKYCGVDCQRAHRKQHKKACKQRAAELKDEQLYGRGLERPEGDFCPICTLPIPLPMDRHSTCSACCMQRICDGCAMAAKKRGLFDCPFCRTPYPDNDDDTLAMIRARVAKKDPIAINDLGESCYLGTNGQQKDMPRAIAQWTKAAELGSLKALFNLGISYENGDGVEQDKAR